MNRDTNIIPTLVIESSNKLRQLLGLSDDELIPAAYPRVVSRKDLSLDNYFAELILRACYKATDRLPDLDEIVIRGSDKKLPTRLNPQIKGAVLIGIGGMSKNKDIIAAYDEHSEEGTRTVDSAAQVVFFRHLERYKKIKPGISSILPVLNEINQIDSQGGAGEGHLYQMVKDLHLAKFYRPGFIVEEYPPQWKRAIVDAILVAVCITTRELKKLDLREAGKSLREVWKKYRVQRIAAVSTGLLMPLTTDPNDTKTAELIFNKALGRTASDIPNEPNFLLSPKRIWHALEKVWGAELAYFVMAFFLEAKMQLQAEYVRTSKMPLDETYIPEVGCSLVYYVMSQDDMKPHRGISRQINDQGKSGFILLKDSHRYTMSIFKTPLLDKEKWARFAHWIQDREPDRWFVMFKEGKGLSEFILNGTRAYLGAEPSSLTKDDIIAGIKEACA